MTIVSLAVGVSLQAQERPPVQQQPLHAVAADYAVIDAVLAAFLAEAEIAGRPSGFVTLRYVVSDRTALLPRNFVEAATNEFHGGKQKVVRIRSLLQQYAYSDLYRRASIRARLRAYDCVPQFTLARDENLPRKTLFENAPFEKMFAPAEGVVYVTLPGYSRDGSAALVYVEMYFALWQTTRLYLLRKHHARWDVRWMGIITEQGE